MSRGASREQRKAHSAVLCSSNNEEMLSGSNKTANFAASTLWSSLLTSLSQSFRLELSTVQLPCKVNFYFAGCNNRE